MSFSWTKWVSKIAYLYNSKTCSSPLNLLPDSLASANHSMSLMSKVRETAARQAQIERQGLYMFHCLLSPPQSPYAASVQAFKPVGEPMRLRYLDIFGWWGHINLAEIFGWYNFRDFLKRWACFALRNHEEHSDLIFEFHHFPASTTLKHRDIVDIVIKQEEMHLACLICEELLVDSSEKWWEKGWPCLGGANLMFSAANVR